MSPSNLPPVSDQLPLRDAFTPAGEIPPVDGHRWVSLADEAGDDWHFDLTFLTSRYHCIYGKGCKGIDTEPDPTGELGCCVHGAYFVDDEDRENTAAYVALLTKEDWQFRDLALAKGGPFKKLKSGEWRTRRNKGACIFLNRDGFAGGAGCALHIGALRNDQKPVDWKPSVCWQVPIRLDVHSHDSGHDSVFIGPWERKDWGEGGKDFNWWCIEDPAAYTAEQPVYLTSRDELVAMVGADMYARVVVAIENLRNEVPVTLGRA